MTEYETQIRRISISILYCLTNKSNGKDQVALFSSSVIITGIAICVSRSTSTQPIILLSLACKQVTKPIPALAELAGRIAWRAPNKYRAYHLLYTLGYACTVENLSVEVSIYFYFLHNQKTCLQTLQVLPYLPPIKFIPNTLPYSSRLHHLLHKNGHKISKLAVALTSTPCEIAPVNQETETDTVRTDSYNLAPILYIVFVIIMALDAPNAKKTYNWIETL